MIFDGRRMQRARKVVQLQQCACGREYMMGFARVGKDYYLKPIPCDGHSLTNKMYSKTHIYLCKDGEVYSCPL